MKNLIIIVLLILVIMFVTNLKKGRQLFDETKKRIKHQLDLANVVESNVATSGNETTPPTADAGPGNEVETPAHS